MEIESEVKHINLLGEYDFSEERLRDSIGINPQKIVGVPSSISWEKITG